jgi:hypothetical protein
LGNTISFAWLEAIFESRYRVWLSPPAFAGYLNVYRKLSANPLYQ